MFHGVGGLDLPLGAFEDQLRFLRRHFNVVSLDALCDGLTHGRPLPPLAVVLTFDDGLRSNHSAAYPLLRKLALPATFYACPGLVESRAWLWNHEARARLRSMQPSGRARVAAELGSRSAEPGDLVEWMKGMPKARRLEAEAFIRCESPGFAPSAELRGQLDVMTWDELRELDPKLITIGSHTVSHHLLDTLPEEEAEYEVAESRRWLERALGREVRHFSYPNGRYNPAVAARVRAHYDSAVTVAARFVGDDTDLHEIPRISVEGEPEALAWRLHRPAV
jgi:peptidoglycan/xylan/chitin deacetylase (PgdA/CDA1 family)